jgi:carbamoyltransferase
MILGVHDGLDAGAVLIDKGKIITAVNEERFTRRKNDVGFPFNSIKYVLNNVNPEDIGAVAIAWISGAALIRRFFPFFEDKRRLIWRREIPEPSDITLRLLNLAYFFHNQKPKILWNNLGKTTKFILNKKLSKVGIKSKKIFFIDHHMCHASSAYYTSGFDPCLIITLDGSGDGLCGSICIGENGEIERMKEFSANSSLGVFFGAVTFSLGMKYSEDELKVMSLAPYSKPIEIEELKKIVNIKNGKLYSSFSTKNEFLLSNWIRKHILSKYSKEELAYATQKHLEDCVLEIIKNNIEEFDIHKIALSGGIFSNVILNMKISQLPFVKDMFVFPHFSDGGLAAGAALFLDNKLYGGHNKNQIDNIYLGSSFSNQEILNEIKNHNGVTYEERNDISEYVGELIANENIVLWFQDKMEYGPRALGNRSILSPAWNVKLKDEINLNIKKRPYFQPFAPTILEEDAEKLLENFKFSNKFMAIACYASEKFRKDIKAVTHIDGTTRPQILGNENKKYEKLIKTIKKKTGYGIILNTSFNLHGYPIVCNPKDAIDAFLLSKTKFLAIGNYFVENLKI